MVSVVVPVYNTEAYLEKCINSILNQSYSDIELILVNDGSTDNSLSICKRFELQDNRVRVIDKPNGGVSSARNVGIQAATGDYLMFCDSDDIVSTNWCAELVMAIVNHPNGFVCSDLEGIDSNGKHHSFHQPIYGSKILDLSEYYFLVDNTLMNQPVNKVFDLKTIKSLSLSFDETMSIAEDLYFNLQYFELCSEVVYVDKVLYYCLTDRDNSLCHRFYENYMDICRIIFKKQRQLFDQFSVKKDYYSSLNVGYIGSCFYYLESSIENPDFSRKEKLNHINKVFNDFTFIELINKHRNEISSKLYYVLKLKSPVLYLFYYNLSKKKRIGS